MGLLERIAARGEARYSADDYLTQYVMPAQWSPYGNGLVQTLAGNRASEIVNTLPSYANAVRNCPPAFAAQLFRALVMSQARFTFRNLPYGNGNPRRPFGSSGLGILEKPWTNATTGELIARMEWSAGLAGNAYVIRQPKRLRVLRPDWVAILYGSHQEPEDAAYALDGEVIGYVYQNGGLWGGTGRPQTILPGDMAHWSPIPDPLHSGVGMSWITPAVREIQGDQLATTHKLRYFENGATPNLVVKGIPAATKEQFDQMVEMMEGSHAGVANAYRTLYLTAGADATVVGSDLKQVAFKEVQGAGETRITALSRVHPVLLGISEGLQGSSLNAGNFGAAKRTFADTWLYPSLQDLAASLAPIIDVPAGAELWTDTADIPLLREDGKDAADISATRAQALRQLTDAGFEWKSAVDAVTTGDFSRLKHSGLYSVQLQPPGAGDDDAKAKAAAAEAALLKTQMDTVKVAVDAGFDQESAVTSVEDGDLGRLEPGRQPPGSAAAPVKVGPPESPSRSVRHLPGKHNQLSHAHGGGSDDDDDEPEKPPEPEMPTVKVRTATGSNIHLSMQDGQLTIRMPPIDGVDGPDSVTLDRATSAEFAEELEVIEEVGTDYNNKAKKVFAAAKKAEAAGGGQEVWEPWFEIGSDGQRIIGGQLDAGGGAELHYELSMGDEPGEMMLAIAIRPPDADEDWTLDAAATDGAGDFLKWNQARKLRQEVDKLLADAAPQRGTT